MPLHSKFRIPVADIDQILLEAQHRWLHTVEAYEILINYWKFELTLEPPFRPPDGSLFLFDRKALRNFRNDGFRWMKRNDGKLVKESHEKLKVCGVDIGHCYYAHRDDNERFQRRIYWLLDRQLEHIVLVHYREANEGIKPGTSRLRSDRGMHRANSLSNSGGGFAVESYPASTRHISFVSSAGRAESQNADSMNFGDFSFPKTADGLPFQSPIPHENSGGASTIRFSLVSRAARADSQDVDSTNSGVFSFTKTVDHPPTRSFIPRENTNGRVAVESSPASTMRFSLVSRAGRADTQNVESKNSTAFSFPSAADHPLSRNSFHSENSGGGFTQESSLPSAGRTSLVSGADKADIQNVDLPNLGIFSFLKVADRPPPHSYTHENLDGGFASGCSPASAGRTSLVSGVDKVDIQNVDLPNLGVFSFPKAAAHPPAHSSIPHENSGGSFASECSPASAVQTSLVSDADRVDVQNVDLPNLGGFSFPKAAAHPPPHSSIPHENSGGGFASGCSPASAVQTSLVSDADRVDVENVDLPNLGVFSFSKAAAHPPLSSIPHENSGGGFASGCSPASTVQTSLVSGLDRVDIQNVDLPNLGVFSFPKAAARPPPHSSIPHENSGGGIASECFPASTVRFPLVCGSGSAELQNVDSMNSGDFPFPKPADRPPPQSSIHHENPSSGFDVESSLASTVQTSFVCSAGGDALSMNQYPAWVSRDICSVSTGVPDLAKKDVSVCGTSSAQRQNMDRFLSERSILGEYIFQKLTDWRFKPHLRLSRVAFGENLASSSDHDNLAVHAEQHNQQNKEAETHITSASHGNYSGNVYMRRKKGVGVVSEAGVQKNLSIKEQSIEAVGMESTHIEHGIRMEEQLDKAVGMESTRIEQGDVQKGEGVEENISVEEHSHEAVGIELTNKDKGHSDLVDDGEMRPGTEGAIGILKEGQQPKSNNDAAEMRRPALALPFVRSSPIWETVESLEIFRKFPQSPHFLPLIDASSGAREGLAIAKMVTFASTAEEAIKLSINDPVSRVTDCLETFQILGMYGFDIRTLENRLTRLLFMKDMGRKKNEAETQVSDLQNSMVELDGEIRETVKRMKLHQEELKSSMWQKEEKDLEIERLSDCLDVLVGLICRNRIEFEELNKSW